MAFKRVGVCDAPSLQASAFKAKPRALDDRDCTKKGLLGGGMAKLPDLTFGQAAAGGTELEADVACVRPTLLVSVRVLACARDTSCHIVHAQNLSVTNRLWLRQAVAASTFPPPWHPLGVTQVIRLRIFQHPA